MYEGASNPEARLRRKIKPGGITLQEPKTEGRRDDMGHAMIPFHGAEQSAAYCGRADDDLRLQCRNEGSSICIDIGKTCHRTESVLIGILATETDLPVQDRQ